MRKGQFPPFGFALQELAFLALTLRQFWTDPKYEIAQHSQKDARGVVSPLWARITGVSPPGLDFGSFFQAVEKWILRNMARKMRKVPFPPSGPISPDLKNCSKNEKYW